MIALRESEYCAPTCTGQRRAILRRRASRPQLKRDPLGRTDDKYPKPRRKRGPKALASAADDLNYEWKMANVSARALARAIAAKHVWAQNIALESFLVHARVIRDFYASSASDNDVLAIDFLGSLPKVKLSLLRSRPIRTRLNRRIAHLSFSRSRLKRAWDVRTLLDEINAAMTNFVALLARRDAKLAAIVGAA